MTDYDFDLFTLGAGSGGVAASRRAASYGAKVAIVEQSRFGGTCVIRGCVPKKLLVYGAHFVDELADARAFGHHVGETSFDWSSLIAVKNKEIARLEAIYRRMLGDAGVTAFEGRARLVDPHTVEVEGRRHTARHILVATGARAVVPEVPGHELALTSDEALDLPTLPRRVVIVGGGYIGVEFAGIFAALGAAVTVAVRGHILRGFDDDVREVLEGEMRKRGVTFRRTSVTKLERLERMEPRESALGVHFAEGDAIETDALLFATGRAPNTKGVGLEESGVTLDAASAIVVDRFSRTVVPSIFAVGDCTNRKNLTPVAIAEGRAVAETLFRDRPTVVDHEGVPTAVFSQPPVATVGLSEHAAREQHGEIDVFSTQFRPLKNAITGRDERTFMKLVVERKTDRVLGAHMVGVDAPEIIQGLAIALRAGATKAHFDATIGIHPTAGEEFVTLRDRR